MNRLLLFLALLAFAGSLHAQECRHGQNRTQNLFIPDFIFAVTPKMITENSAVSFLSELGRRNWRINGTYGMRLSCDNLFKVSGEYLQQRLGYNFSSGRTTRWMHQGAIGTALRHEYKDAPLTNVEIGAYYSYARSRNLSKKICRDQAILRHIAGSSAFGFSMGGGFILFEKAHLQIDANYDAVIYHRKFSSNKYITGFGASIDYYQNLFADFGLGLKAEFRRPFNYYKALLNWIPCSMPGLAVGVFGTHTRGKSNLPSNTALGIELSYIFGEPACVTNPSYWVDPNPVFTTPTPFALAAQADPSFKAWMSDPAVYMPEVLAIADQARCPFVTSSPIPNFVFIAPGAFTINTAPFFSNPGHSAPLTFFAAGLPSGSAIDAVTGIITGTNLQNGSTNAVTVTATNACSSSSQTFTIFFALP